MPDYSAVCGRGAGNHAWRPERRYWVVMRRLANIAEKGRTPSIHVCGEAYSDYHGFIEGSLRSAVYALHCILKKGSRNQSLKWLKDDEGIDVKSRSPQYFKALQMWVRDLDTIDKKESHLWHPRSSRPIGKG
jgi:hypothetical protein